MSKSRPVGPRCPTAAKTEGGMPVLDPWVDRHGSDLVGEDEHSSWWGTDLRPLRIYEGPDAPRKAQAFIVEGYMRGTGEPFDGRVLASSERAVRRYFARLLADVTVERTTIAALGSH